MKCLATFEVASSSNDWWVSDYHQCPNLVLLFLQVGSEGETACYVRSCCCLDARFGTSFVPDLSILEGRLPTGSFSLRLKLQLLCRLWTATNGLIWQRMRGGLLLMSPSSTCRLPFTFSFRVLRQRWAAIDEGYFSSSGVTRIGIVACRYCGVQTHPSTTSKFFPHAHRSRSIVLDLELCRNDF